jgi:capsular exopolysaccharide synthesis family protein
VFAVVTAPGRQKPSPPPDAFRAAHTLILANNNQLPEFTEKPLNVYSLMVKVGEVPKLAASRLNYKGDPFQLVRTSELATKSNVLTGTITITAYDKDRKRAALIVDTFADSLKTVLADQTTQQRELKINSQLSAVEKIQDQLDELNRQMVAAPDAVTAAGLDRRKRPLERQLDAAVKQVDLIQARPDPYPALLTLESGSLRPSGSDISRYFASLRAADAQPQPRRTRALFGLLIGLLVGCGISFAIDFFDPRLRSRAKVEELLGLPVVAEIPLLSRRARRVPGVLAFTRPLSPLAEGYRVLRTAVMRMPTRVFTEVTPATNGHGEGGNGHAEPEPVMPTGVGEWRPVGESNGHVPKVVLVCSPRPREGKTMTVANLAVCLAESGHTVLVLDSDLRAPQAHKRFDVKLEPGLSVVLSGRPDAPSLTDVAQDTSIPGVRVIAAGSRVSNPGRLLARAADLVREAREMADFVIIDSAPTLTVNDAIDFMPEVDEVIPVIKNGATSADAAFRMGELLVRMGARVLGVVIVGVPVSRRVRSPYGRPPSYQLNLPTWTSPSARRVTKQAAKRAGTAPARTRSGDPASFSEDEPAEREPEPTGRRRRRLRWSWSSGIDDPLGEGPA